MVPQLCVVLGTGLAGAGCLVTGDAGFEDVQKTPPHLINPQPPPQKLILVAQPDNPELEFGAVLVSEDDGDDLNAVLLIDYGIKGPGGVLWENDVGERPVTPGTAAQPRVVTLKWAVDHASERRCNSVTMMVTHNIYGGEPYTWCPLQGDDFDTVTWYVGFCPGGCTASQTGDLPSFADCPNSLSADFTPCPPDPVAAVAENGG